MNEPFAVGPRIITLKRWDVAWREAHEGVPAQYETHLQIGLSQMKGAVLSSPRVEYRWIDAGGGEMLFAAEQNLAVGYVGPAKETPPMKLIVSVPDHVTLVKVPFEMKGLKYP
jgi:hypothetical protein